MRYEPLLRPLLSSSMGRNPDVRPLSERLPISEEKTAMNLSKQTRSTTNGSPLDPASGSSGRRITRFPSVSYSHTPVMSNSVIELFSTIPSGTVLDATIGGGGHSSKILKSRSDLNLIGLDQDPEAIKAAEIRLKEFGDRVILINERFDNLDTIVNQSANQGLSGVLFDLGVSSYQLDNPARGFSYRESGPLDMRMNTNSKVTAYTLVNKMPKEELAKVLRDYGDERFSRRIADAIFAARPIKTTKELSSVISMPCQLDQEGLWSPCEALIPSFANSS